MKSLTRVDPISLEIAWGRLQSIVDEAATALMRGAYSAIIREAKDFTIVLLDASGGSVVQSTQSIPGFIGSMPRTMRAFLEKVPVHEWRPGDVLGTNDPWIGSGHLPDINLAMPIFINDRPVAFVGVIAHMADIGGRPVSAAAPDIFEEGLRIPVSYFRKEGELNQQLLDIIASNVRVPAQVLGDIRTMMSVGHQIDERLRRLVSDTGLDFDRELAPAIQERSERAMRNAIGSLPEGTYHNVVETDGIDEPLRIEATITLRERTVLIDYTGTSKQIRAGVNSSFGFSYAYTAHAFKCILSPSIPINEGSFRPIVMTAPPGTIVNSSYPAAVAARSLVAHYLNSVIYGALVGIMPERVIAESGSPRPVIRVSGRGDDGEPFMATILMHGGMGASAHKDGLPCIAFPTNTQAIPIEIIETTCPMLVEEKEFITDSGGAGRYRGGLGQRVVFSMLADQPIAVSIKGQRDRFAPRGLFGGHAATLLRAWLNRSTPISVNGVRLFQRGERLTIEAPGGGGFGDPRTRDAAAVATDLRNGVISPEAAATVYGLPPDSPDVGGRG